MAKHYKCVAGLTVQAFQYSRLTVQANMKLSLLFYHIYRRNTVSEK